MLQNTRQPRLVMGHHFSFRPDDSVPLTSEAEHSPHVAVNLHILVNAKAVDQLYGRSCAVEDLMMSALQLTLLAMRTALIWRGVCLAPN